MSSTSTPNWTTPSCPAAPPWALHESQSRLFENLVGRSRGCIRLLWPTLKQLFPSQLEGVTEEELYRAANRASRA